MGAQISKHMRRIAISTACAALALVGTLTLWASSEQGEPPASQESKAVPPEAVETPEQATVFFVTNRKRKKIHKPEVRFGGKRGEPAFGICEVGFKPIPGMEEVADKVLFFVPAKSTEQKIEVAAEPEIFWGELAAAVEATTSGDVVVFVHGYSYDLERGCDRAAEAQRILSDKVAVLLFTWPSNGRPTDYGSDRKDLVWSVPFLQTILQELARRFSSEHVQVLAHSLGSKGVLEALLGLVEEGVEEPLMSGVVLLAPDVDIEPFLDRLAELKSLGGEITLYASSKDTPLKVSRKWNGAPRLGQAGEFLTVVEGVETVDVTRAGRYQYTGHEYFHFHPLVVADLMELVRTRRGAAERAIPQPAKRDGMIYWEIVAEEKR